MGAPVVVDTEWLAAQQGNADVIVVDVRPPQFYTQGHIPGAVNLPIFLLSSPWGGPPGPDSLAARLGSLGIGNNTHVVAYDDGASPSAASLFRALTGYGHRSVSVLDGGITKWRHEGRDLEYTAEQIPPAEYQLEAPVDATQIGLDETVAAIQEPDTALLDVRSPAEYLGHQITAAQDGHIPGAVNVEWSNNLTLTPDGLRVLRSDGELRELYRTAGVRPDKRVIVYCQTGERASETYLILRKLGFDRVSVYLPGWVEWGNRPDLPVEE